MQGDVIEIYNTSGSLVMGITYDAWGNFTDTISSQDVVPTTEQAIALGLPFRYRSYYYDSETGFYYLNSRYYDPQIRRFINADGYVNANGDLNGFNMFAYCGNNPVNRTDATGQFWISAIIIAAIVIVCATTLSSCTKEPDPEPYSGQANCYAYAMGLENDPRTNKPFNSKPQPGEFSGNRLKISDLLPCEQSNVVKNTIESKVSADAEILGLTFTEVSGVDHIPAEGNWIVALAYSPGLDYHWWKQNKDGTWSHKPGSTPISQWDMSGNIIYDPKNCDRGIYTQFLGYYEVGPNLGG